MHKTSFLEIMRVLDKEELKRFEAFLSSPYFNTRNNVIKLFGIIKKYAPEFDNKMLDKEELWKKLFPDKEYNYGIIKNIIHDITKLTERFLEVEVLNSDEMQRMKNLLRNLSEKQLETIFMNKYNTFEKNYLRSAKFYYGYYDDYTDLKRSKFVIEAYNPKIRSKHISSGIAELMIFDFMSKFSNNFNNVYIEESEYNELPDNDFIRLFAKAIFTNKELDACLENLNTGTDKNFKTAIVFFRLMKCYLNPQSIEIYYEFKRTLFENDKYISESALRGLYANLGSALDNCKDISGINKNRELFEIIKHLVDKNIFLSEDGKVIASLYLLSVKTAGYLREYGFIEMMIKDFLPKIDPGLKDNFYQFSLAYLYYSKKDFDKSLDCSNKITIDSFQMKYFLRNLQIILSYEKDDYNMFQYLNDSYRHFLAKNKSVSESYKESNMKFLNYTNTLFKLRESNDKSEIGFINNSLLGDVVVNKYWLIDKLKELAL